MSGRTLFDKIWDDHVVVKLDDENALLHVDRHIMHDLGTSRGLADLEERGYRVRNPELTFATPDHAIPTDPGRNDNLSDLGQRVIDEMRRRTRANNIRLFDLGGPDQGIVHVVGPELGLTLPGSLVVCGDSHTCTQGAMGAVAFGIGSSELLHVLATQTLEQQRPKRMRVRFEGRLPSGAAAKDMILALIGEISAAGGDGHAVEYAGPAIEALDMEGRLTICNLSIELGAKIGFIAPDDTTFGYLADRPFAPKGADWDAALAYWRGLPSDPDADFDREVSLNVDDLAPQITWGTSPQDVVAVDGRVPDPATAGDGERRAAMAAALDYMGLTPGMAMADVGVDYVFIGSCTNSRIQDLRAAAALAGGRKVADGVVAWVVPGSERVKRQAEAEGLDKIFLAAGFEWREPGCSRCVAANGEVVPPGRRSISTSNRNFVGRQGPRARTHLVSPVTAVAAAVSGKVTDPRRLMPA